MSHEHESLGTADEIGVPILFRESKLGGSMEAQTHTTGVPLEPCTTREFHFHEALLNGRSYF